MCCGYIAPKLAEYSFAENALRGSKNFSYNTAGINHNNCSTARIISGGAYTMIMTMHKRKRPWQECCRFPNQSNFTTAQVIVKKQGYVIKSISQLIAHHHLHRMRKRLISEKIDNEIKRYVTS
jgi:hypothetical protein